MTKTKKRRPVEVEEVYMRPMAHHETWRDGSRCQYFDKDCLSRFTVCNAHGMALWREYRYVDGMTIGPAPG